MNINEIVDSAENQCRKRGVRLTKKRKMVLECLLRNGKPTSAYSIVDYFKDRLNEHIPAMSVYRILKFLQNNLLVHKIQTQNKFIVCSHIACDHDHQTTQILICQKCNRVEEVLSSTIFNQELQKNLERTKFQLFTSQFEINCICISCHTEYKNKKITSLGH